MKDGCTMKANQIIKELELQPHIEGGYFKEMYASEDTLNGITIATSIYFLLEKENFSALHKLTRDEMWFYHGGQPLTIAMIDLDGNLKEVRLGMDLDNGEVPFFTVPKEWIFGSYVEEGFALVSCVVAPGFTYDDFKLYDQAELLETYPNHHETIMRLTR